MGETWMGELHRSRTIRGLYIVAGSISLGLGIVGIVLPILPTTPFLLLAAACYARGSKRFYDWLLNHRWFGKYIRNYRDKKGVPIKVKAFAIMMLWLTILISMFFFIPEPFDPWPVFKVVLFLIALTVTVHILRLPTYRGP